MSERSREQTLEILANDALNTTEAYFINDGKIVGKIMNIKEEDLPIIKFSVDPATIKSTTEARIMTLETALSTAEEALVWSRDMFCSIDEMRAIIKCGPHDVSPATDKIIRALQVIKDVKK